jgi:ribonuclease P protein component
LESFKTLNSSDESYLCSVNQSFGKQYKLCSKKRISEVFESNQKVKVYPFVGHYISIDRMEERVPFQIVLSVPKRNFRKAHDRNRIKRQMHEVVRKNKLSLEAFMEEHGQYLALFIIYTSKEELSSSLLDKKVKLLISELIKQIEK